MVASTARPFCADASEFVSKTFKSAVLIVSFKAISDKNERVKNTEQ